MNTTFSKATTSNQIEDSTKKEIEKVTTKPNATLNEQILDLLEIIKEDEEIIKILRKECLIEDSTKLGNKKKFNKDISSSVSRYIREKQNGVIGLKGPAIIVLDLNNLKEINDKYGHDVGDTYLYSLSESIRKYTREGDTDGYRIGGDEFVVIIDNANMKESHIVAQRIKRQLHHEFQKMCAEKNINLPDIKVSASAGYSTVHEVLHDINDSVYDEKTIKGITEKMFKIADKRMYEEKKIFKSEKTISSKQSDKVNTQDPVSFMRF